MTQNWIEFEGRMAGDWRLDSYLGNRDGVAVFQSSGESGDSMVKILRLGDENAAAVRNSWTYASKSPGDHLLRVYATGEAELNGTLVFFAVMEVPDICVDEIVIDRAVSDDEARSLVAGAAGALEYLHQRGLQHGSITPAHLHVVGNVVKLGVDTIAPAVEDGWQSDMRQLGTTLIRVMAGEENAGNASVLPRPFQAIAKGCLGTGGRPWTAHRVLQTLSGSAMADPDTSPSPAMMSPAAAGHSGMRLPLVVTAAVLLAGIGGYWWMSTPAGQKAPAASLPVAAPPITTATTTTPPSQVVESTRARTVSPAAKNPAMKPGWAVIAAAYVNREAAEGRAARMARSSRALQTQVFTSSSGSKMSYVLLGSGLTRDEAEKVLRTARRAGAPRDSYVTKLGEK